MKSNDIKQMMSGKMYRFKLNGNWYTGKAQSDSKGIMRLDTGKHKFNAIFVSEFHVIG